MDTTGRDEEDVAGLHLVARQDIDNRTILYTTLILFTTHFFLETAEQSSARLSTQDVPHFGLAEGVVATACQIIVGVNLNREVVGGIDELYEQREFCAIALEHLIAKQNGTVFCHQAVDATA